MLEALSNPRDRTRTLVFLAIFGALATAAVIVGIEDNPPGILLAFGSATALVLAVIHPWRTAKQFRLLLYASVLGFVMSAILHNVFEGLASKTEVGGTFQILLQGIGVAAFLLAVLICPPAILVGSVGSVVMFIRNRRRPTRGGDTAA